MRIVPGGNALGVPLQCALLFAKTRKFKSFLLWLTALTLEETLINSPSAEQRIFCPSCAVLKMGKTYSITAFLELSSVPKPSAVGSRLFNHRFLGESQGGALRRIMC